MYALRIFGKSIRQLSAHLKIVEMKRYSMTHVVLVERGEFIETNERRNLRATAWFAVLSATIPVVVMMQVPGSPPGRSAPKATSSIVA